MTLSTIQVKSYLDRISVSESTRTQLQQGPSGKYALEAVATLQRQHLKHVPFENLDLMYSSHHSLPQDTESVFDRVVNQQRGGVCDQIHLLFMELLKHFGFSVYCTGSRINSAASLGVVSGKGSVRPKDHLIPKFGPW
jgi:arylamine N-acetyltransferase